MPKLPGVNHKQAIKAFEKAGFYVAREGKHVTMTNGEIILSMLLPLQQSSEGQG